MSVSTTKVSTAICVSRQLATAAFLLWVWGLFVIPCYALPQNRIANVSGQIYKIQKKTINNKSVVSAIISSGAKRIGLKFLSRPKLLKVGDIVVVEGVWLSRKTIGVRTLSLSHKQPGSSLSVGDQPADNIIYTSNIATCSNIPNRLSATCVGQNVAIRSKIQIGYAEFSTNSEPKTVGFVSDGLRDYRIDIPEGESLNQALTYDIIGKLSDDGIVAEQIFPTNVNDWQQSEVANTSNNFSNSSDIGIGPTPTPCSGTCVTPSPSPVATPTAMPGDTRRMLILPVYALDQSTPSSPTREILDLMMNGATNSLASYFRAVSYGTENLSSYVANWLHGSYLSSSTSCYVGNVAIQESLEALHAAEPSLDLTQFGRVLIVINQPGCPIGGIAFPTGTNTYNVGGVLIAPYSLAVNIPGISKPSAFDFDKVKYAAIHETGHMYHILHSNFFNCGEATILPGCISSNRQEYSDPYSVMGGYECEFSGCPGGYTSELTAIERRKIGWLSPSQVAIVPSGTTQTFDIDPVEGLSSGIKSVFVRRGIGSAIWIEFRQAVGEDSFFSTTPSLSQVTEGGLIHLENFGPINFTQTLLDPTANSFHPTSNKTAALLPGESWFDPYSGITINSLEILTDTLGQKRLRISVSTPAILDTTLPIVRLLQPNFATYRNDGLPFDVVTDASDNSAVDFVQVLSGLLSIGRADYNKTLVYPYTSAVGFNDVSNPLAGANAKRYFIATAFDMMGNASVADVKTLYVDKIAPTPYLYAPIGPRVNIDKDWLAVSMSCSDSLPGKPMQMGVIDRLGNILGQTKSNGSFVTSTFNVDVSGIQNGETQVGIFCNDEAGHLTQVSNVLTLVRGGSAGGLPDEPAPENPLLRR